MGGDPRPHPWGGYFEGSRLVPARGSEHKGSLFWLQGGFILVVLPPGGTCEWGVYFGGFILVSPPLGPTTNVSLGVRGN